jgi:hypothetical protein
LLGTAGVPRDALRRQLTTVAEAERQLETDVAAIDGFFDDGDTALSDTVCLRACAAIGSMRRSVEAVCRLAGNADTRCISARERLERSEQRVRDAGCGC